jgi:hypothetical protein
MWLDPEYREKVVSRAAEASRRTWSNPAHKAKMAEIFRATRNPETTSISNRITWADQRVRAKRIAGIRASHSKPEVKQKMSDSQKLKWRTGDAMEKLRKSKEPTMKPVICVETGQVFDAIKAAVRWLVELGFVSASKANIRTVCQGKSKSAYGFHWRFAEGGC